MSAIASFYLVRKPDVEQLKHLAAQPVGADTGGKWHDSYWEFLLAHGRELEQFESSGYVMLDVFLFLDSRSIKVEEYCDEPLSDFLHEARGSTILAFQAGPGKVLAELIASNMPDENALGAFLSSPDMVSPVGDNSSAASALDGVQVLTSWLSQIDEEVVGLLSIG
ncbi:MAG TPA: hypothetical protein VFW87_00755 [Pirellulales bacterium]|nr:hypothetical protein [Pirellulales bacterium]